MDVAGQAASNITFRKNGVIDTSQLTQRDLSGNEGALLLQQMATSANVYTYEEGKTALTAAGSQTVDGVLNLDDNAADFIFHNGKSLAKAPERFPIAGVNGSVTVDPSAQYVDSATGMHKIPTRAIAFHELAESFAKVEHNLVRGPDNGPGAHLVSRLRELILIRQRPNWTPFPAGGVLRK